MTKKIRAALMGGTGYAAAELIRRLVTHPNVELVRVGSVDHLGENVGDVHRNFGRRLPYVFQNFTPEEICKDVDVVFLALPHKVSFEMAPKLFPFGVKIIDFSGDYRIRDAALYEKFYKVKHSNPENLSKFIYGLPELFKNQIKEANYVANPGCFPTSVALSLLPLAANGLLKGKVRIVGATGSSGSGVHPGEGTHHPTRSKNLKSYKPLNHQHEPEMEQTLILAGAKDFSLDFIPTSAPLTRGIITCAMLDLPREITEKDIAKLYESFYKDAPFVKLTGAKNQPEVASIAGTNFVEVGWSIKEERLGTKSFAALGAIDNLVKGAAGQAVQNLNLMFGLPETTALDDFALWP